ncbi:MAG: hypothetical protein ACE5OZ_22605 [Candidatus Heimdallarchaeota archaeon]
MTIVLESEIRSQYGTDFPTVHNNPSGRRGPGKYYVAHHGGRSGQVYCLWRPYARLCSLGRHREFWQRQLFGHF